MVLVAFDDVQQGLHVGKLLNGLTANFRIGVLVFWKDEIAYLHSVPPMRLHLRSSFGPEIRFAGNDPGRRRRCIACNTGNGANTNNLG